MDELFEYLFHPDRMIMMRVADAVEKIAFGKQKSLIKRKQQKSDLCHTAIGKELNGI